MLQAETLAPETTEIHQAAATLVSEVFDSDILGDTDVWTPAIDRLISSVSRWIRMDSPGAAVYGPQRVGKTHACQFMQTALPVLFGGTLTVLLLPLGGGVKSERAFLQSVMAQVGCNSYLSRDDEVLRDRLVDHLYDTTIANGSKRVVMIWDEAQKLTEPQYGWLITLFNALEHRKLRPFFLLVGQPELRDVSQAFRAVGSQHVIGRFFSNQVEFAGIDDSELRDVLRALDTEDDDGASPRRYLPVQYAEGFELESLADPLGEALGVLRNRHQLVQGVRLPMQYLRSAVLVALMKILHGEVDHRNVSSATMLECLRETGFLNVVVVYAELTAEH
jgi:type II secretory pathway predicted ATPase ExeA